METRRQLAVMPAVVPIAQRQVFVGVRENPCIGCSLERSVKVLPTLPSARKLIVVGWAPGEVEERAGFPFAGPSGQMLRSALSSAGLEHETDVGYLNLGRCRPAGDDFESLAWAKAEDRCWNHLRRDLAGWTGSLLLLGSRPLQRFLGDKRTSVKRHRGLLVRTLDGRVAFAASYPSRILRASAVRMSERARLEAQFFADVRRMADRVLDREHLPQVHVDAWDLRGKRGRDAVAKLARAQRPWFFDIETYDVAACPSRPGVATDPFHPDFRVRGVAVAWGTGNGAWLELMWAEEEDKAAVRTMLDPVFRSKAEKGAFVSGFDANGLIAQGWVTEVKNLTRDPWLAAIALDIEGWGHSLERLTVDVLGEPQPLGKGDRGRIREMPLEQVAEYAVRDACLE